MGSTGSKPGSKMAKATPTSTWKPTFSLSSHESRKEPLAKEPTNTTSLGDPREKKEAKGAGKAAKKAAKVEGEQTAKEAKARLKEDKNAASK